MRRLWIQAGWGMLLLALGINGCLGRQTPANLDNVQPEHLAPRFTAPRLLLGTWSPNGRFLAFWAFSPEEVARDFTLPPGSLFFLDAETGTICPSPVAVPYDYEQRGEGLRYLTDGRVLLHETRERSRWQLGTPCQPDFITVQHPENLPVAERDPARSPGGGYRVVTVAGEGWTMETRLLDARGNLRAQARWTRPDAEGSIGVGGWWVAEGQFLIPFTPDQGPLLLSEDGTVIRLAPPEGPAGLEGMVQALAGRAEPGGSFHVVIREIREGKRTFWLYHGENGRWEAIREAGMEAAGLSPDGRWLWGIQTARGAGETSAPISAPQERPRQPSATRTIPPPAAREMFVRAVDGSEGSARRWALRGAAIEWAPSGRWILELGEGWVELRTAPEGRVAQRWEIEGYGDWEALWAPDDRWIALIGHFPSGQPGAQNGLFLLPAPER